MKIKLAIVGYGNLGKGVENAVLKTPDMELTAVFTRRDPASVKTRTDVPVFKVDAIESMKDKIDVVILCGGSANDLPKQTPEMARHFCVIDSFDTHAKIPEHFAAVDTACREAGTLGIISCGWDPGMFSLNRLLGQAILPDGMDYTFWGRGVSQGHSDAIRRIPGLANTEHHASVGDPRVLSHQLFLADEVDRCIVIGKIVGHFLDGLFNKSEVRSILCHHKALSGMLITG